MFTEGELSLFTEGRKKRITPTFTEGELPTSTEGRKKRVTSTFNNC